MLNPNITVTHITDQLEKMAVTLEGVGLNALPAGSESVHSPMINTDDRFDLLLKFHHFTTEHTSS